MASLMFTRGSRLPALTVRGAKLFAPLWDLQGRHRLLTAGIPEGASTHSDDSADDDAYFFHKVKSKRKKQLGEHPLKHKDTVIEILGAVKKQIQLQKVQQNNNNNDNNIVNKIQANLSPFVEVNNDTEVEPTSASVTAPVTPPLLSAAEVVARIRSNPPTLPSGTHKPKQSLSQNYLNNKRTVADIVRAFYEDALLHCKHESDVSKRKVGPVVEMGPGIGALTEPLLQILGSEKFQCIELDERSVKILQKKHPDLRIHVGSVLQFDYNKLSFQEDEPLTIIGNLPFNITSRIMYALVDAAAIHGAVRSATVTMQWEVSEKVQSPINTKDYGILAITLQLYTHLMKRHFRIPSAVFYPQPKVDSALMGLHYLSPEALEDRLDGVRPAEIRQVLNLTFQQRRKTLRNSIRNVYKAVYGDERGLELAKAVTERDESPALTPRVQQRADAGDHFALRQRLPSNWPTLRPEGLTPGQFVELTRLVHSEENAADGGDQQDDESCD